MLHRDLKPANILLTLPEDEDIPLGTPKIADFGLAKQLGMTSIKAGGPSTQSGAILGTPGYMAPEQADGKGKKVGPAADVYALGAILYETLTGKPPFEANSALDTLMRVLTEEPTPPRQLQPKVPRDLETICLRCLAKEPHRRYASARELADDLRRFLEDEPILARPQGSLERLGRWLKRRREWVYLMAGAVITLGVVLAIVLWPSSSPEKQTSTASRSSGKPLDDDTKESPLAVATRRTQSQNNLKEIVIGLHNIHEVYTELPPPAICDRVNGRPLLSWRVAILPYIEQETLYKQFHLNEPWDSAHNIQLLSRMPRQYQIKGLKEAEPYTTHYQAIVGPGAAWERLPGPGKFFGAPGLRFPASFADGTSNTILVTEAAQAVPWTKPEDVEFTPGPMRAKFGGVFADGFNVAMADGRVLFVSNKVEEATLRAAITRAGGEVLPENWEMSSNVFQGKVREEGPVVVEKAETKPSLKEGGLSVTRVPLSGKVTYRGKPLDGGQITFSSIGISESVKGVTINSKIESTVSIGPDGTYRVSSLAPGRYQISITPPPGLAIPAKYQKRETSPLSCEVKAEASTFNINID
jgi:hypothetical protein